MGKKIHNACLKVIRVMVFKNNNKEYLKTKKIVKQQVTSIVFDGKRLLQLSLPSLMESRYSNLIYYNRSSSARNIDQHYNGYYIGDFYIAVLHKELMLLGYKIADSEVKKVSFGIVSKNFALFGLIPNPLLIYSIAVVYSPNLLRAIALSFKVSESSAICPQRPQTEFISWLQEIEEMDRQKSQAIESLEIFDHSVKCQRCGTAVPIVGKLPRPYSNGIAILQKRIKWSVVTMDLIIRTMMSNS
jgi:hypothetical protein